MHYTGATPFMVARNTITAVNDPAASYWDGILISSQQSTVGATFDGNLINGSNAAPSAVSSGFEVWNTPTTGNLTISGGQISVADYGVFMNTYEGYNSPANSTQVTISGADIAASEAGVYVKDSLENTSHPAVSATIENTTITTDGIGIWVDGANASATVTGNHITAGSDGIDVTDGRATISDNEITANAVGISIDGGTASADITTGNEIDAQLIGISVQNGADATITGNTIFGNAVGVSIVSGADGTVTGNTFNDNAVKQFEGDATTIGLTAGILASNTFDNAVTVRTAGTISVPAIFSTIQGGVNAATAGDAVKVEAGTYEEDVLVNSSISLLGSGALTTTILGVIGGDSATVRVASSNVEIAGFTITRQGKNLTDWNNAGLNSAGIAIQGMTLSGSLIHDNVITGNRTGIDINNSSGHTVRNNAIVDNRTGMLMRNQTDNLTVIQNEIADNWTVGVLFIDASSGTNIPVQSDVNCTFTNNDISGNWYGQVVDRQVGGALPAPGANLKNFSGNWFGSAAPVVSTANSAEPGYAALIPVAFGGTAVPPGGQPEILGSASANIDYTPWLMSGADTNPGMMGFQGDFSQLMVDDDSPQTGTTGRIQEAVGLVNLHGTVNLAAGTYAEQVNIAREITIQGAGIDQTIIDITGMPAVNNDSGICITADNVTLAGLTLIENGVGTGPRYGVYVIGTSGVTVEDVKVTGLKRTGVNINGAQNLVLDGVQSLNNGGAGIFMTDVKGALLNDITTAGNPWTGVSIATKGQYYPLGTYGIVFSGSNSFGESSGDNGGLQLEGFNFATNSAYPITWSTLASDNANVTILGGDFGYALSGPSYAGTPEHYTRFYQSLSQAQTAAAGNPEHIDARDRFIRTTNGIAEQTNYYVYDVTGDKMSIQAAVDDAKAGDTVHVAVGTFTEQVDIGKNLTLIGQGDDTLIKSPAVLDLSFTWSGTPYKSIITVHDAANVAIESLKVDGDSLGAANNRFTGIGYYNAGGLVSHVTVTGIHDAPLSGVQHGYGILARNDSGTNALEISDNIIANYQKNGIDVRGAGLTAEILRNEITGEGAIGTIAQNGIVVLGGPVAHLAGNIISANSYTGADSACGILIWSAADGTKIDGNNSVSGNEIGVYITASNVAISGNTITGNAAGVDVDGGTAKIQNNNLTGNAIGIMVENDSIVDAGGGALGSTGDNDLRGYTGVGNNYAIRNQNTTVPVMARNNDFGPYSNINIIENYIFDDTDDNTVSKVDFDGAKQSTAIPNTVYVDNEWAGDALGTTVTFDHDGNPITPDISATFGVDAFAKIQEGINAVAATGVVNVLAGTYAENLIIDKSIKLIGAGEALVSIVPSFTGLVPGAGSSNPSGSSNVILVQANNVEISNLTVDGDNPTLTSGVEFDGADIDARNGIITNHAAGTFNNLNINHVTVQNIYLRGIYASSGGTFTIAHNTITNVQGENQSIAIMNWMGSGTIEYNSVSNANNGIVSNWSKGTSYRNNTVTNAGSGIHTDNNGGSGGTADLIEGNTVINCSYGIFTFAPYVSPMVRQNTIIRADVGLTASGGNGSVATHFIGNVVDGQGKAGSTGLFVTTEIWGYGYQNVTADFQNNIVKNVADGLYVAEDNDHVANVSLFNNSFSGNSGSNITNAGRSTVNASGNWWGVSTDSAVADTMSGKVDFTPWLNSGVDTNAVAAGFQGDFSSLSVGSEGEQLGDIGRIQEAVDLVTTSTTIRGEIDVYAGDYAEGSLRDWHTGEAGTTAVGLIVYQDDLTIRGIGLPTITATMRDQSLADHIVSGDRVTLTGLKFQGVANDLNGVGPNKTLMDIGNEFILSNSVIDNTITGWSALYISNEWESAHVESFQILDNDIGFGDITIANGAGQSDPTNASLRRIEGNTLHDVTDWAALSFNSTDVNGWNPQKVGAITVADNVFTNNAIQIMMRGNDYVNPDWVALAEANTFDKAVLTLADTATGDARINGSTNLGYITDPTNNLRLIGTSIQEGIDRATAGDTVKVFAGTYNENVNVNERVTLEGAGVSATGTVINAAGGIGLNITTGGADATHRLVLSNLLVTGGSSGVSIDSAVGYITLDNVVLDANTTSGLEIHNNAVVTDLVLNAVTLSHSQAGLRVASTGSVNGLSVTESHFDNNEFGLYNEINLAKSDNETDFQNINISNSTFSNDTTRGIYVEKLQNAVLDHIQVINSGAAGSNSIDINLKQGNYSGLTLSYLTVVGDNEARGLAIKARNDGTYAAKPARLTGVDLNRVSITDSITDLYIDNNVSGLTFTNVELLGTGVGLSFYASAPQTLNIGNTTFAGTLAAYIGNGSANSINATDATFGLLHAPDATTAEQFAIVNKIVDGVDIAGLGLVRTRANEVFVTPNSFFPTYTTSPSIQRGIDVAAPGDIVNVQAGSYVGQLEISKPLTILGEGASTVIKSSDVLAKSYTTGNVN